MKELFILRCAVAMLSSCKKSADTETITTTTTTGTHPATLNCSGTTAEKIVCAPGTFISGLSTTQQASTVFTIPCPYQGLRREFYLLILSNAP